MYCTSFLPFIILVKRKKTVWIVGGFTNTGVFCRVGLRKCGNVEYYFGLDLKIIKGQVEINF